MNIFYLDPSPAICAAYHNDRHCVKMILESCQLLSNALPEHIAPFKRTHYNHPCSVWVRKSMSNWWWLYELTSNLFSEWRRRYNHDSCFEHKCFSDFLKMGSSIAFDRYGVHNIDFIPFTPPPQCMPDDCKCDDTVQAYRNYYIKHKGHLACWKNGKPEWYV